MNVAWCSLGYVRVAATIEPSLGCVVMVLKDTMTLTPTSVIKRGAPGAMAREAQRTRAAYELAASSGLFRTPQVVRYEAGTLELERIDGMTPMQRLLAQAPASSSVWARLGAVLAAIHGCSALAACDADQAPERLPEAWRIAGAPEAPLHGDFDAGNLFYREDDDVIVVIDWSVSPMLDGVGVIGPRCFDVAFFVSGAFFLARRLVRRRGIEEKLRRFVAAYESSSGQTLDRMALQTFARRAGSLRVERQPKSALHRWSYRRSMIRLERFLEQGFDK